MHEYICCNKHLGSIKQSSLNDPSFLNVEKRVELIAKKVKAGEASAKARENKKKQDYTK